MSVNIKTDSGLEKIAGNYAGSVTKEAIGLGNVDNTSDANKPISTATQTALDTKENSSNKVSDWQSTPDDNHYPSEKLVKDGLDAKVAKIKIGETEYSPTTGIVTIPEYPTKLPASDVTDTYSATGKLPVSGTAVASAISGKEDSVNRVSSWSGTTSHAKYPSEKLVKDSLDDKVNKTSVSSSNETTSVINVTDAKAQMAMVAKISGKTVKFNQVFNFTGTRYFSTISANMNNGYVTLSGTNGSSTGNGITFSWSDFKIISGHKYVYRSNIPLPAGDIIIDQYNLDTMNSVLDKVITARSDYAIPQVKHAKANASYDGIKGRFMMFDLTAMFGAGNEPTIEVFDRIVPKQDYEPTSQLWSAPVESVVSVGANMADSSTITRETLNGTGAALASTTRCVTDYIRVKPSSTLKVSLENVLIFEIHEYTYSKGFIKLTTVNAVSTSITLGATTGYVRILMRKSSNADILPSEVIKLLCTSNGSTTYSPYNKTTVLVPSEARNCVGYGLGISDDICNIADFENGVHTQMCAEVDLGTLDYTNIVWGNGRAFTTKLPNVKNRGGSVVYNAIAAKYDLVKADTTYLHERDKILSIHGAEGWLYIVDDSYNADKIADFKKANLGVKLVYELGSTVTKPLTDFIRPLPVEQGGTLTLVNEHNLDVNSVIKYKKEV